MTAAEQDILPLDEPITLVKAEPEVENAAEEAAVAEVNDDDIRVPFRGTEFVIPRATLTSARFLLAFKTNELHTLLYETLGANNAAAFIELCRSGESLAEVANEFFDGLNKAAGLGN